MKTLLTIIVFFTVSVLVFSSNGYEEYINNSKQNLSKCSNLVHKNEVPKFGIEYIDRFAKTAIQEEVKFGIPAEITLAQGILESSWGNGKLVKASNNHFGIKCFRKNCHKDHCTTFSDDNPDDRFTNYETAWLSYRNHSLFLFESERYKHLFELDVDDYKSWAIGLKESGYATDPDYAEKLIYLIEKYELFKLT